MRTGRNMWAVDARDRNALLVIGQPRTNSRYRYARSFHCGAKPGFCAAELPCPIPYLPFLINVYAVAVGRTAFRQIVNH